MVCTLGYQYGKKFQNNYYVYGFSTYANKYLLNSWDRYTIDNMEEIRDHTNYYIPSYDRVNFLAYQTLLSMFFDTNKKAYILFKGFYV